MTGAHRTVEAATPPFKVFALTGGIGTGKSAVAKIFAREGLVVVDADLLARRVVEPGQPALLEIAEAFGQEVLREDGSLDRGRLGALVFGSTAKREILNAIVHPRIRAASEAEFRQAEAAGHELCCYEIPLLFETGQEGRFRPVVVVAAEESTQIKRVMERDSLNETEARARVSAQMPVSQKAARADIVISNDGTLAELEAAALSVLAQVRAWG